MGFLAWLKCKMVRINPEMTSRVTIRERLSKRAVMKEKAQTGGVSSTKKMDTKRDLTRVMV